MINSPDISIVAWTKDIQISLLLLLLMNLFTIFVLWSQILLFSKRVFVFIFRILYLNLLNSFSLCKLMKYIKCKENLVTFSIIVSYNSLRGRQCVKLEYLKLKKWCFIFLLMCINNIIFLSSKRFNIYSRYIKHNNAYINF